MSRIGKLPVELPDGVNASIANGEVSISGPKGSLNLNLSDGVNVEQEDKSLVVNLSSQSHRPRPTLVLLDRIFRIWLSVLLTVGKNRSSCQE